MAHFNDFKEISMPRLIIIYLAIRTSQSPFLIFSWSYIFYFYLLIYLKGTCFFIEV